jgi:D-aminopeptidase
MFKNFLLILFIFPIMLKAQEKKRARDYGVNIGVMQPGKLNAITGVAGVKVGQAVLRKMFCRF